ncbi:MAG: glycerol-3-phosphate dehydrogenase, partial [Clostridia bacterium]|nr:glycerol-3-phosphate dehydrogenase [Clostridia bacterium]
AGILIGQGKSADEATKEVGMVVEGIKTCKTAYQIAVKLGVEMPIVETAYDVLFNGKDAKTAVSELMGRDKKEE